MTPARSAEEAVDLTMEARTVLAGAETTVHHRPMRMHRETLRLETDGEFDIVDITPDVERALAASGVQEGHVVVYSPHTTCFVLIHEKETGLIQDMCATLARLVPQDGAYVHDDFDVRTENMHPGETRNAYAHLRGILAGKTSEFIPIGGGALRLGTWQRVMLIEFDRARPREVLIQVSGV